MPYWHAVRTHRLLIIAVTAIALIVAFLVVQTSTKRYDADADLSINPRGAFATTDPLAGAPPTAVFFQPADGSSVTTEAARLFSSPAYLSAFYASRAFRRLGPRASQATISVTPLSQADLVAIQVSASNGVIAAQVANRFADFVLAQRTVQFQKWLSAKTKDVQAQLHLVPAQSDTHANLAAVLSGLKSYAGSPDPTVSKLTPAISPPSAAWPRPKETLAVAPSWVCCSGLPPRSRSKSSTQPSPARKLTQAHRLPVLARIPRLPAGAVEGYFQRATTASTRSLEGIPDAAGGAGERRRDRRSLPRFDRCHQRRPR